MAKIAKRYLCHECKRTLQATGLVYSRIPFSEGSQNTCDWCHREKPGVSVKILYRRNET